MRKLNQASIDLIKSFESLRLDVYDDGYGYATVGWGHRTDLPIGTVITQSDADTFLKSDLGWAQSAVDSLVLVPLNDNQYGALVSLVFNIGAGNFKASTLLRDLNAGDFNDVPAQEARWDYAGGRISTGLDGRRAAEIALWNTPDNSQWPNS
jgi:lysozyme